jgi:selenoprotein W-related protein
LAEKILTAYKRRVASLELVPADGGVFEVSVNGNNIYSKKQTGEFPDFDALVRQLKSHV